MSWIILALLSAVFAALVAIFGKIGIDNVDNVLASTIRATIMALVLVLTSLILGKFEGVGNITSKGILFIFLAGLAGAISWIFYFSALKIGPASGVAALDRLSVVIVLLLSVILLSEKLTVYNAIGTILIVTGAIFFVLK